MRVNAIIITPSSVNGVKNCDITVTIIDGTKNFSNEMKNDNILL